MNKNLIFIMLILGITLILGCIPEQENLTQNLGFDKYKTSTLNFIVVDAITREPIENALLQFYITPPCKCRKYTQCECAGEAVGEGLTDSAGRLKIKFETFPEAVTISADGYSQLNTGVHRTIAKSKYDSSPEYYLLLNHINGKITEVIQTTFVLVNKNNILIDTKEKAIEYSNKDNRISAWLNRHNVTYVSSNPTTISSDYYWIVNYEDVSCIIDKNKGLISDNISCIISVKLNGLNGKVSYILNDKSMIVDNPA